MNFEENESTNICICFLYTYLYQYLPKYRHLSERLLMGECFTMDSMYHGPKLATLRSVKSMSSHVWQRRVQFWLTVVAFRRH